MPATYKVRLKGAEQIREAIERLRGAVEGFPTTLRALVRYKFEHAAEMYRVEPNPLYAWDAYGLARATGEPIPEFVLEYFDRVAANFSKLQEKPPGTKPELPIAKALEMKQEGAGNVFTTYKPYGFEWVRHALLVLEQRKPAEQGRVLPERSACENVAENEGVSFSTVWRHWTKAKKLGLVEQ